MEIRMNMTIYIIYVYSGETKYLTKRHGLGKIYSMDKNVLIHFFLHFYRKIFIKIKYEVHICMLECIHLSREKFLFQLIAIFDRLLLTSCQLDWDYFNEFRLFYVHIYIF